MLASSISIEIGVHGPVAAKVLFPFVMLSWLYFLLKGVRWVWIVTVGIQVLGIVPDMILGSLNLLGGVSSLVGLVLLLLPVTWQYFSSHAVAEEAQP